MSCVAGLEGSGSRCCDFLILFRTEGACIAGRALMRRALATLLLNSFYSSLFCVSSGHVNERGAVIRVADRSHAFWDPRGEVSNNVAVLTRVGAIILIRSCMDD